MKRILTLLALLSYLAFGYNFNGTWINTSGTGYNEPAKLIIKKGRVSPVLKRGKNFVRLKTKTPTKVVNGFFEVWGIKNRSLALVATPINSSKIRVIVKKINPSQRKIVTKSYIFTRKSRPVYSNQFLGSYHSRHNNLFTAISRVVIFKRDGRLYVKAWRNTPRGERPLGIARARLKGNRLYMEWEKRAILVRANITGIRKNAKNRYKLIKLNINARNLRTGVSNSQSIVLKRDRYPTIQEPLDQIENIFHLLEGY